MDKQTSAPFSPKRVLHLSVDYPCINRPVNTPAVRNFIQANPDVDYHVFALTRTPWIHKTNCLDGDGNGDSKATSMAFWGLPYGIFLFLSMTIVAWRVRKQISQQGLTFDMIHAHKMTFEGIAAWWLSRWLKIPFVVSVRGEAESKIFKYKPHYKPFFQHLLNRCAKVFYVSAWFKPIINNQFVVAEGKQSLLPNFVSEQQLMPTADFSNNKLVTILNLDVYKKKGLDNLVQALQLLSVDHPNVHLDVIGRGSTKTKATIQGLIDSLGLNQRVVLCGEMSNQTLLSKLPNYAGLVLPSFNETFGMVYVEAMMSGVPILHSKSTGIDGFIDWVQARVAVDPSDVDDIAAGLITLLEHQHSYRQWLLANQQPLHLAFKKERHIEGYNQLLGEPQVA
ncbi:glycosyltransferase [Neiella marina]|uniref:Glycosyltransferase n=1 Tax=Neiella holothuriorum TaxID=2870530 RepID=A0ABS7EGH5_9GAMM|nr:glycosyltransferase [Neiella holothuriorum]MBW8191451.1 glycosyltransferase [Neiella holothuriorum]